MKISEHDGSVARFNANAHLRQSHTGDEASCYTSAAINMLGIDEIAVALGYLDWKDILRARVCKRFRDAAKITLVPMTSRRIDYHTSYGEFVVDSPGAYHALGWMSNALTNLQQISFHAQKSPAMIFEDGEDPNEADFLERYPDEYIRINTDSITPFPRLQSLAISNVWMNGRYPQLFRLLHLKVLNLRSIDYFACDLETLCSSPVLEVLSCGHLPGLEGDVVAIRKRRDSLRKVTIIQCTSVRGDIMNFYDLPRLESLRISNNTPVTGDLRNLKDCDFPALKELSLPKSIVGGASFQFDSVADAPEVMNALCRLKSRNGTDIDSGFIPCHPHWRENHFPSWRLSDRSIEHYPMDPFSLLIPPFQIEIVEGLAAFAKEQ